MKGGDKLNLHNGSLFFRRCRRIPSWDQNHKTARRRKPPDPRTPHPPGQASNKSVVRPHRYFIMAKDTDCWPAGHKRSERLMNDWKSSRESGYLLERKVNTEFSVPRLHPESHVRISVNIYDLFAEPRNLFKITTFSSSHYDEQGGSFCSLHTLFMHISLTHSRVSTQIGFFSRSARPTLDMILGLSDV